MSNIDVTDLGFSPPKVPMLSFVNNNADLNVLNKRSRSLSSSIFKRESFISNASPPSTSNSTQLTRSRPRFIKSVAENLNNITGTASVDIKPRSQSHFNIKPQVNNFNSTTIPRPRSNSLSVSHNSNSTYIPGSLRVPILPIEQHQLNVDPNPILINKKPLHKLHYIRNVSLKFLKPPLPEKPGDITIIQEPNVQAAPEEPLRVLHKPPIPPTPPPRIFREKPPKPPVFIPTKHLTIPGKVLPPPPRQVIVEKLPELPQLPPDIIIERWLGYKKRQRRVIFRPAKPLELAPAPKNLIIQWDSPEVILTKQKINLGIEKADPGEYAAKNNLNFVDSNQLPPEVNDDELQPPAGFRLAANSDPNRLPSLIGEVEALKYLKEYLQSLRLRNDPFSINHN